MAEEKPKDVIPANGFIIEMPGLTSPHIDEVSGMGYGTGSTEQVDGGTNRAFFFSDGIYRAKQLTFSRPRDGSPDDAAFAKFFDDMVASGRKFNGTLIQYRFSEIVMKVKFQGLLCNDFTLTDMKTDSTDKAKQQYQAMVDYLDVRYNEAARQ